MAFTDFKSADEVQERYQIKLVEKDFLTLSPLKPSESFVLKYQFAKMWTYEFFRPGIVRTGF